MNYLPDDINDLKYVITYNPDNKIFHYFIYNRHIINLFKERNKYFFNIYESYYIDDNLEVRLVKELNDMEYSYSFLDIKNFLDFDYYNTISLIFGKELIIKNHLKELRKYKIKKLLYD